MEHTQLFLQKAKSAAQKTMKYICFYMVKRAGNLTDNAADKTTGIVLVKKTPYFLLYILKEQALHALRRAPAFGKPNY